MTDINTTCAQAIVKALYRGKGTSMAAMQAVFDRLMAQHKGCDEHRVRAEVERLMMSTRGAR